MSQKNIELLNQKITGYLTAINTQETTISTLNEEISKFKKAVSSQKSLVKKLRDEKQHCMDEINALKKELETTNK